MATAASDKPASTPEDATARLGFWRRVSKPVRFLRRIPTPLLITITGLVLSAWLFPAITRQWDDRQRAHEVKTALLSDVASATAHALIGGDARWSGRRVNTTRVADAWSLASTEIETRFRVYFDAQTVTSWQVFSWFVYRWLGADRVPAGVELLSASRGGFADLDPHVTHWITFLFKIADNNGNGDPNFRVDRHSIERRYISALRRSIGLFPDHWYGIPSGYYGGTNAIEAVMFQLEHAIAQEVIKGHVTGYSTSTSDLLHDLIP